MKRNLLLLGMVMFYLSTINSFAQTVNGPQAFGTYLETFDSGKAEGWTPLSGPWIAEPNTLVGTGDKWYAMTEGGYMRHSIYNDATFENYAITADVYPVWGNKTGIIFNYQDADNYYVLEFDANGKKVMLRQKVAGIFDFGGGSDPGGYDWGGPVKDWYASPEMKLRIDTVVASEWLEGDSKFNKVKITNANGKTNVWFNEVKLFTDVPTPLFTKGKVGVYTNWCLAFFDNFQVESFEPKLPEPPVVDTYSQNFDDGTSTGWTPLGGPWTAEPNSIVGDAGKWYAMTEGGYMRHSIYNDATFENFTLTADIYPVWGNKTGIIFNYQDPDNYYVLEADANGKKLMLRQKVDGVFDFGGGSDPGGYDWVGPVKDWYASPEMKLRIDTLVASEWLEGDSKYNNVKITNANGKTSVWFNNIQIFTEVPTPLFTKGRIGVYTNWCLAFFDNINVVKAAPPVTYLKNYSEDFEDGQAQDWTPLSGPWATEPNAIVGTGGNWYHMTEGGYMRHSIYDGGQFKNYEFTADVYPVWGNKTGIIFNYQDADNFYVLEADANGKKLMLRQKVAGVFDFGDGSDAGGYNWGGPVKKWIESPEMKLRIDTVVASEWLEGDSKFNKVKITNADGKTNVWFNDVKIFTDVETPLFTSGKIGVYTNWCLAFFDNIKVGDITTGVSTQVKKENDLKIYPNPVTGDVFTISNDGFGQNVMVNIYNTNGSLVYSKYTHGQQIRINTKEIRGNSGLYILKATSDQKTYVGKFLIQ